MPNFSGIWSAAQQFQARGQNIWPKAPGAPTIGTATAGNSLCASVTFTAPACTGYPAGVTGYRVTSTPGCITNTGASSPIVVSGLTNGTSYTFKVSATNATGYGPCSAASNSITASNAGSQSYTCAGTYSWVAPAGVTSVSIVAVAGGGGGSAGAGAQNGGGGGELRYKNNISVTPGNSYTVVVGAGGVTQSGTNGGNSTFNSTTVIATGGRSAANGRAGGSGGTGDGGGNGGAGGVGSNTRAGGGGAGGYSGAGGAGGGNGNGSAGTGGAAGGGGSGSICTYGVGGPGGGVGICGQGSSGAGGTANGACNGGSPSGIRGGGGSCGNGGGGPFNSGGLYGGGAPGYYCTGTAVPKGGRGAVRIIWPGTTRQFPSTCVGNP